MLLSIIIPVYNIELYIDDCIKSCITQNINSQDYEIIIVNDGSSDDSLKVVQRYQQYNSNITIINKINGGLSSARNAGLNVAQGKYIWFIDGDDVISNNCIKDLLSYIQNQDLDILFINYSRIHETAEINNTTLSAYDFNNGILSGGDFFKNRQGDFLMVWRYIFKKSIFSDHGLRFYEGIIHEDVEFTHKAIYYAKRIGICYSVIYYYRTLRKGSIMSDKKTTLEKDSILKIIHSIQSFRDNNVDDTQYKKLLDNYLLQIVANYIAYREKVYNITGSRDLLDIRKSLNIRYKNIINTKKKIQLFMIKNCIIIYSQIINSIYI